MASCFELPSALVDALCDWDVAGGVGRNAAAASAADSGPGRKLFRWHSRQSCLDSLVAHEETSNTYADLRILQQAIRALARVVDGRVQDMRQSLVASPWRLGFEALPYELVVDIIEFATLPHANDPEELRETMKLFLRVPGFAHCVKSATPAVRLLKDPSAATGLIPSGMDLRTITRFFFTANTSPFSAISEAMKQMVSLEHLELSARFSFAILYQYNADWISNKEILLPSLVSLRICDSKQTDDWCTPNRLEPDWSPNNNGRSVLSWVIGAFDAPKLRHVSARLTLRAGSCSASDSNGIPHALDLPHLDWPVETFELEKLAIKDRQTSNDVLVNDVVHCLKRVRNLSFGSCDSVRYAFDIEVEDASESSEVRAIRLEYPEGKSLSAAATKPSQLLSQLLQACRLLKEVIIVSDNPEMVQDARSVFAKAYAVTTRSILDETNL